MFKEKKRHLKNITLKISLAVFIVLVFITGYFFEQKKISQEEHFYDLGKNYLTLTSNALNVWLFNQLKIAQLIAEDPRVIAAAKNPKDTKLVKEAHDFLQETHRKSPHYENLPIGIFTDEDFEIDFDGGKKLIKNGTFITDTVNGVTIGKGGMNYSFVRNISAGKDYFISKVYPSILRGNPIFVLTVPVRDNENLIGFVGVSPQIDFFTKSFIDQIKHNDSGYVFIFDDRRIPIAHPDSSLVLKDSEILKKQAESIVENVFNNKQFFESEFKGVKKYYVADTLPIDKFHMEYKWYLCFTQNRDEVLGPAYRLLKISLVGSLAFSLLISSCVYVVGKSHIDQAEKEILRDSNLCLEEKVRERTKLLQKKAVTDGLTGLSNHRHSLRELKKTIENPDIKNVTIIMSDLDYFKKVNDKYGHPTGDKVLMQFSKIIKSNIRTGDIAGRYGGEEFIIILPDSDLEAGIEVAERIRIQLHQYQFEDMEGNITSSFGVCQRDGEEIHQLVKKADDLLYQAKLSGRNCTKSTMDSCSYPNLEKGLS